MNTTTTIREWPKSGPYPTEAKAQEAAEILPSWCSALFDEDEQGQWWLHLHFHTVTAPEGQG